MLPYRECWSLSQHSPGDRQENTLGRLSVHCRAHTTHTLIHRCNMHVWDFGRKPDKPHRDTGRTCNFHHKCPKMELDVIFPVCSTFLRLWLVDYRSKAEILSHDVAYCAQSGNSHSKTVVNNVKLRTVK